MRVYWYEGGSGIGGEGVLLVREGASVPSDEGYVRVYWYEGGSGVGGEGVTMKRF